MKNYSRNESTIAIKNGEKCIIKIYDELPRFLSEYRYTKVIQDAGFLTHTIINRNIDKRQLTFNYIDGIVYNRMPRQELLKSVETLANIYLRIGVSVGNSNTSSKYITNFAEAIRYFTARRHLTIDEIALEKICRTIRENFRSSIFIDAKVQNWVFSKTSGMPYMIDFDYVRDSFVYADLAQLLSSQYLEHDPYGCLHYFNKISKINIDANLARNLLDFAILNSKLMAMKYNNNIDKSRCRAYIQYIKQTLTKYGVLSE